MRFSTGARGGLAAALLAALLLAGSVLAPVASAQPSDPADADDGVHDPWEGMNRGVFWFNDQLDQYALSPAATAWDALWPDSFERSLGNVFRNARFPIVFLNNWLQWKPRGAGIELARFLINSTVGLGGLCDPAKSWGLVTDTEDFGQTLGVWGVPRGPYLVLPILGPSNPRDTVGLAVDSVSAVWPWFAPFGVSPGIAATQAVNFRSIHAETIDSEREAAFDWYAAVRNAYVQRRDNQVNDRESDEDTETIESDLYFFDDE